MKNLLIFLTILLLSLFIGSCSIDDVQDNIDLEIEEYAPLSATDDIVALMENFKTNILNNRNTIEAYKNNQSEEEIKHSILKDCGFVKDNRTIDELNNIFEISLRNYISKKEESGLIIESSKKLEEVLKADFDIAKVLTRSPCGECDADYFADTVVCLALGFAGPAGPYLAYACQAANIYELSECYDTNNCN